MNDTQNQTIEREIHVEASPEVVFSGTVDRKVVALTTKNGPMVQPSEATA